MIVNFLYPTKGGPTWNVTKLKEYLRLATSTPQEASSFSVSEGNVLRQTLTAVQYSALTSHFYAIEGEPTILHAPYRVKYVWICQQTFQGAQFTLIQDQKARDVYTMQLEIK